MGPDSAAFYHALLRPAILQILRAQGYYSTSPVVLDTVTELAGRYITELARSSAEFAERNNEDSTDVTLVDMRMAMEQCGVFFPEKEFTEQEWAGQEHTEGVDNFIRWAQGKKNAKIRKSVTAIQQTGTLEGMEEPVTDYLSALKKKHNKTDQDSKYAGTVLGKGLDHGEVQVEGGPMASIHDWQKMMQEAAQRPPEPSPDSRPPSSGLSSLTDGDIDMMELS